MRYEAPWTGLGAVQQEVENIKSSLWRKADTHEVHEANRRLDSLERSVRQIRSDYDELQSRLYQLETNQIAQ